MSRFDRGKISSAICRAFVESDLGDEETAKDVSFHMTDWLGELEAWVSFCEGPDKKSADEISNTLFDFLIHVPAHVAAARRLLTGNPVTDVFGVGAVSEEKDEK